MLTYKAYGSEYLDSDDSQLWQMTGHEIDSLIAMVNRRCSRSVRLLPLTTSDDLALRIHGHHRNNFR